MVEEIDPLSKVVKKITNQQNASEAHAAGITVPQCLMLLLILTLWIVVLATFRRYGFTTDEDRGLVRAERIFAVFSSGRVAASSEIDLFHGAAPDLIALLLQKFFPTLSYDPPSRFRCVRNRGDLLRLRLCEPLAQRVDRPVCCPIPCGYADVVRLYV